MFEVLFIKKPETIAALNQIVTCIVKRDFSNENILFFRTNEISVHANRDIPWTLDGEQGFSTRDDFKIKNIQSAISFYVPDKN